MNKKQEAIKRLDNLEKESKKLRDIIESEDTLFDRIKTYSDVCEELDIKELTIKDFKFLPTNQRKKTLAFSQIQNIIELFNDGWLSDWKDSNQYKYYPYYYTGGSIGFRFAGSDYPCGGFGGGVGFYKDKETSNYCGKQFIDIYENLL